MTSLLTSDVMMTFEAAMYGALLLSSLVVFFTRSVAIDSPTYTYTRMLPFLTIPSALYGLAGYVAHDAPVFRAGWSLLSGGVVLASLHALWNRKFRSQKIVAASGNRNDDVLQPSTSSSTQWRNEEPDELSATRRIRLTTIRGLLSAAVVAIVASMITVGPGAGVALLIDLGLISVGFVVGFLFSVPKAVTHVGNDVEPTAAAANSGTRLERIYSLNTNLEQVSDWLTKIIVGVGLVEAGRISNYASTAARSLGGTFHNQQTSLNITTATALALGMLIAFPSMGFLIGFFSVRLYISQAMYAVDKIIYRPISFNSALTDLVDQSWYMSTGMPTEIVRNEPVTHSSFASPAFDEILRAPLNEIADIADLVTRGRAALLKGRPREAATAFELAIKRGGTESSIYLDYARTYLQDFPISWSRVIELLQLSLNNFDATTSKEVRQQTYWELLNAYLYLPPPNGFSAAIALGAQYVSTSAGSKDPYAHVYLASAHGQAYSYLSRNASDQAHREGPIVYDQVRLALLTARMAGVLDEIRSWLLRLATTPVSEDSDDDLFLIAHENPDIMNLIKEGL